MAEIARGEEAWWQAELARLASQMLLPGRPARGGGRTAGEGAGAGLALEILRLGALAPAVQRRLLRLAAERCGVALDFAATESVRRLALEGRAGQKVELPQGLRAERTARELRLAVDLSPTAKDDGAAEPPAYNIPIPGAMEAPAFGLRLSIEINGPADVADRPQTATLRNWRPGDRVRLRYSSGPRKVKEVLDRLRVTGTGRAVWPVLEIGGRIVWMQGAEVEREPGLAITAVSGRSNEAGPASPPPQAKREPE